MLNLPKWNLTGDPEDRSSFACPIWAVKSTLLHIELDFGLGLRVRLGRLPNQIRFEPSPL